MWTVFLKSDAVTDRAAVCMCVRVCARACTRGRARLLYVAEIIQTDNGLCVKAAILQMASMEEGINTSRKD